MNEIHFSSKSVEHYTPSNLVQAIQNFYNGVIDLDPCSNTDSPNVPACFHYNKSMNGLTLPWAGKVYVNPPYGGEGAIASTTCTPAFDDVRLGLVGTRTKVMPYSGLIGITSAPSFSTLDSID